MIRQAGFPAEGSYCNEAFAAALAGLSTWSLLPEREQLLVGSYLWQASLIVFALGALAIWFWEPRNKVRT
jgi:hypothetical protein